MRVGVKPGQWGWTFEDLSASWKIAEESGFHHISCFDHVSASPQPLAAWDAPSLLVAMAGATTSIDLEVQVLNASLRHPFLLAGQLAVAQAVSGGRLRVGLGAGSHHLARFDHEALGIGFLPHRERVERLAACCRILPALWRGEVVDDPALRLTRASLGPTSIEPPSLFVGGGSDAVMGIAARLADGWYAPADPERFPELARRLDDLCANVGRDLMEKAAPVSLKEAGLHRAAETVSWLAEQGAEAVTFILHEERDPQAIHRLAQALASDGWLC
jgi:alkanesulfonate monooxygenase SsuD/methylene tetrahydromethanopterin reductase-like flavin-dependent oxidoreductase (luciferase family)